MIAATTTKKQAHAANPHRRRIVLAHGGGGQLMDELLAEVIRPRLANQFLATMDDAAILPMGTGEVVFTTDSYVVQPLEFPGGDIGRLAISGTVNDLAVCGAVPQFVSLGLILEEGLDLDVLRRIVDSIANTAAEAGVQIVTGDTKVVARGEADGIYISTTGIGMRRRGLTMGFGEIRPGDVVLINGTIADHGLAVMLQRESATVIRSDLRSDTAPLGGLIGDVLDAAGDDVAFMRDPTRGGVAGVVAELAGQSGWHLVIDETALPIRRETQYAAEMLGLDPLNVANEGKVIVVVRPTVADQVLEAMRRHALGSRAAVIGRFEDRADGLCEMLTDVGGRRIIQKPYGEELPRIC